jgi:hypothetical protein
VVSSVVDKPSGQKLAKLGHIYIYYIGRVGVSSHGEQDDWPIRNRYGERGDLALGRPMGTGALKMARGLQALTVYKGKRP